MKNNTFYGDKLRLARLLKGYTQQQLGELISVTRQYIHQLETGSRQPASDVLNALYEILDIKPSFFQDLLLNDVKLEQCHFRKRATTPQSLADRVASNSTVFEILVSYINDYLVLPKFNFPSIENSNVYTDSEIESAAEKCRKHWKLGIDTPIANMTRLLENAGIIITQFHGLSEKVDALSINRKFPIIVRNDAKESICRMRFDLAHECGHFVLHVGCQTGDWQTESEADKFASALLFPRVAFHKEFPDFKGDRLNWDLIYKLKLRWGISVRALIYRAHYFNRITAQQYRTANVWLNKTGQSKIEKLDDQIQPEEPELLAKSLRLLNDQLGITSDNISDYMGINKNTLSEIIGINFS